MTAPPRNAPPRAALPNPAQPRPAPTRPAPTRPAPTRPDLIALTEDGLIQLANVGLVRRALRENAAGQGPVVNETAEGVVEARFADGTLTRLPAGRMPGEATCSCPSGGLCRHRVALVVAYQHQHRAAASAPTEVAAEVAAEEGVKEEEVAAAERAWDPGTMDGAAFEASLPAGERADLARLLATPLAVRLERGPVPCARLPMATVRFLVPGDIGYARCDCKATAGCAHVALAVRAFKADREGPETFGSVNLFPNQTVESSSRSPLIEEGASPAEGAAEVTPGGTTAVAATDDMVAAVDDVLSRLLAEGVVAGMAAHGRGLDRARTAAGARGATWLVLALEALADQTQAYDARSARYDDDIVLTLVAELYARTRATGAAAALGQGEAMATPMAKTRLASLGVRIAARGTEVTASAALADTDTGSVQILDKRVTLTRDDIRKLPDGIGDRLFAPGLPVRGVACGQILTTVARRRADGLLMLGQGGRGRTTLLPWPGNVRFGPPLRVERLAVFSADLARRPPALIAPRNQVPDIHAFDVEAVLGQAWAPGAQLWHAAVTLAGDGGALRLERRHDAGAPQALAVLSAAVAGHYGPITRVAGPVRLLAGVVICQPWSLVCADRLIVPDLEETGSAVQPPAVASDPTPASAPQAARRLLAGVVHAGLRGQKPQLADRCRPVVAALRQAGFEATARRLADWQAAADTDTDCTAFCAAALWITTLLDS